MVFVLVAVSIDFLGVPFLMIFCGCLGGGGVVGFIRLCVEKLSSSYYH